MAYTSPPLSAPLWTQRIQRTIPKLVLWVALVCTGSAVMALWNYRALQTQFMEESSALHRTLSQRADQHDAHLTALSAVALAPQDTGHALFRDVADTIVRFYPRISDIALVPFDTSRMATGTITPSTTLADTVRTTARQLGSTVGIQPHPFLPGHYLMIKRSPNNQEARYGVMLTIDAQRLADDAGAFWRSPNTHLQLSLPDGTALTPEAPERLGLSFTQPLGSVSQPLLLHTHKSLPLQDLFPVVPWLLLCTASSVLLLLLSLLQRQRQRVRSAVERARISSVESRLAHASRVNALGEMAGGMAHELTQPLTAILSQAQAGRRLLERGKYESVAEVLNETVTQAQRASAILQRLRNWSRPQNSTPVPFDLRESLATVQSLMAREAESRQVMLTFNLPDTPLMIRADPVEMEQVLFNLIRNALEAVGETHESPQVTVVLASQTDHAVLDVIDNGPGVPESIRSRLFTPFTTTRANGTGLGLTLSQRLVERAGGELVLVEGTTHTTFRVTLPIQPTHEQNP